MVTSNRVQSRHEGSHHKINIKYGNLLLCLTVVFALLIYCWRRFIAPRLWRSKGYPPEIKSLRTRKAQLFWLTACWSGIILGLAFFHINLPSEYVTLGKRFGRLAYALVPLDILLVIRPGFLGNYLDLVGLHKWISRIIFACLTEHALAYYYKWWKAGDVIKKSFHVSNLLGVIVFWVFVGLIIISLKFFRNKCYGLFYIYHNVALVLMVVLIPFHARPGVTVFAIISVILLGVQLYYKVAYLSSVILEVVQGRAGSKLQVVKFVKPNSLDVSWLPGSHIRLNGLLFKEYLLPSHPYTISSPHSESSVSLIIQKSRFIPVSECYYVVSGPFESSIPEGFYENADQKTILIICGGSGISFGLPVHQNLQSLGVNSRLVWVIRSKADLYILDHFSQMENVDVYVTGISEDMFTSSPNGEDRFEVEELLDEENGIQLETMEEVEDSQDPYNDKNPSYRQHRGRPQLDDIGFGLESEVNPWVIACGPKDLVNESEKWCSSKGIHFLSETYQF
ncbi:Ferric reductase like transmembrane component [Scheffersomyces spartinae]|uniref:Probable metalloreductase AIM14 n=1 Tax=Scheffersomyces spartinae TaxID=45513 RepID=A0A9P7V501_9ASCO|nr:Ferric reductase like transmembrane component [Scheffersomyces spartinae]KAG7191357.1 Ferric reductase like transmembrane component [Scheffersomyces spartinae]